MDLTGQTFVTKIIDPTTLQQKAGTVVSVSKNIGKWNQTDLTIAEDGTETVLWQQTIARRWKNAPLVWGGAGAGLAWILWRALR